MAKCKRCGKKGLFLKVNSKGLCDACVYQEQLRKKAAAEELARYKAEEKALNARLKEQDRLIAKRNKAEEKFKKDNDLNALITAYEEIFIKADTSINCQSGAIKLADLYIKAGDNNKAWKYLNSLLIKNINGVPLEKIRFTQSKILKKECKYKDAVEMLILGYIAKSTPPASFNQTAFEKDIKTMAKKMEWDDEMIKKIENIIITISKSKQKDKEKEAIAAYRALIEQ